MSSAHPRTDLGSKLDVLGWFAASRFFLSEEAGDSA